MQYCSSTPARSGHFPGAFSRCGVALTRDGISTNENGNARKRADARASARAGTLCAEGESIGRVFLTMGLVAGLGYFLIALGPALTLFVSAIAPRPFLILAVLASALIWLLSLISASIVWRPFLPGPSWVFLPMLITAVALQEVVRVQYWHLYLKLENSLNVLASKLRKLPLNYIDRLNIALASGVGHGTAHAVFFGLSIIAPAFGPATYYTDSCKQMPLFLVTALTTLAFNLIHTFSMLITFNAYTNNERSQKIFVPVMHLGASLLTLINLLPNGCTAGVPLVFLCALSTMAYGGKIVWDNVGAHSSNLGDLHETQFS